MGASPSSMGRQHAQRGELGRVRLMRRLGKLGVWYPIDRLDAAGIKLLMRTVEDLGYSTFWYPEALGYESLSIKLYAGEHGAAHYRQLDREYLCATRTPPDAACAPCPASMTIASSSASAS